MPAAGPGATSGLRCKLRLLCQGLRLVGSGAAQQVTHDPCDVDVAVLQEDTEFLLRPGDGGSGDVNAGNVGLHRALVENGLLLLTDELDARLAAWRAAPRAAAKPEPAQPTHEGLLAEMQRDLVPLLAADGYDIVDAGNEFLILGRRHQGTIEQQLPWYEPGVMVADVPLLTTVTPAVLIGRQLEWLAAIVGLAGLVIAGAAARKRRA